MTTFENTPRLNDLTEEELENLDQGQLDQIMKKESIALLYDYLDSTYSIEIDNLDFSCRLRYGFYRAENQFHFSYGETFLALDAYVEERDWTIHRLIVKGSSIETVSALKNFRQVKHLTMQACGIKQIDLTSFPELEYLNLSDNLLTQVPDLTPVPHLKALVLTGNPIQESVPSFQSDVSDPLYFFKNGETIRSADVSA